DLAMFQFNIQQYQEALSGFESALQIAETLDEDTGKIYKIANSQYMLGRCYGSLKQPEVAISWYEKAVELYVEIKDTKWALSGLEYLINLYREFKQDEQVIASYQRRLEIFRELGDRIAEYSSLYDLAMFQ
ncbi:tetratricopeptide repeat protein, partial [Phormidium sp. CCY1219]|uniref:tetratricopeptide repeat protein n=1 Tax=Phormidium sp. CCY1219 TaxID=2886104 RepID=UPI002D1F0A01